MLLEILAGELERLRRDNRRLKQRDRDVTRSRESWKRKAMARHERARRLEMLVKILRDPAHPFHRKLGGKG